MAKKRKLTPEQKKYRLEKKKRNAFQKGIEEVFRRSGFRSLPVEKWQVSFSGRQNEMDHLFIYQNIIVIVEDTAANFGQTIQDAIKKSGDHRLKKQEFARNIRDNLSTFVDILKRRFPESECPELHQFATSRYKVFVLYCFMGLKRIPVDWAERFPNLRFVNSSTMKYMLEVSEATRGSFKYELFRYFGLSQGDLGDPLAPRTNSSIKTHIIYPEKSTGFSEGIRLVSFMISPADLLENSYVLRKDGWGDNYELYQRLITPKRIKSIRSFLANGKTTFVNNIIVTLPPGVSFNLVLSNGERRTIDIAEIDNYLNEGSIEMLIPSGFNSMAIIDGQHRAYAFYEDRSNAEGETINGLRKKLHLLVTGIYYVPGGEYSEPLEQRKFESKLFMDINLNAKSVDPDTLIQIKSVMDPASPEALSRRVIETLNNRNDSPFRDQFQLSKMDDAPIKTASIIKFALSSLLSPDSEKTTLFKYWIAKRGVGHDFRLGSESDVVDYVSFSANVLIGYFKAVCEVFQSDWNADNGKLKEVLSINAFIIALRETLDATGGPKKYEEYKNAMRLIRFSFRSDDTNSFPYGGSQYSRLAKEVIEPALLTSFETNI